MKRQVVSQHAHRHTHTVCYSNCRRHRAPSVDRGLFLLQPGCAAVGGAGAAWAGSSVRAAAPPVCHGHGSSRTTNIHRRDSCTPPPSTQSPRPRWKTSGDTKKLTHSESCVPLLYTDGHATPPSTTVANPNTSGFTITTHELKLCVKDESSEMLSRSSRPDWPGRRNNRRLVVHLHSLLPNCAGCWFLLTNL